MPFAKSCKGPVDPAPPQQRSPGKKHTSSPRSTNGVELTGSLPVTINI